jgi:hypothetical protein
MKTRASQPKNRQKKKIKIRAEINELKTQKNNTINQQNKKQLL